MPIWTVIVNEDVGESRSFQDQDDAISYAYRFYIMDRRILRTELY